MQNRSENFYLTVPLQELKDQPCVKPVVWFPAYSRNQLSMVLLPIVLLLSTPNSFPFLFPLLFSFSFSLFSLFSPSQPSPPFPLLLVEITYNLQCKITIDLPGKNCWKFWYIGGLKFGIDCFK